MPPDLQVPPVIEAVIQEFDQAKTAFTDSDVQQALGTASLNLIGNAPRAGGAQPTITKAASRTTKPRL